MDIGPLLRGSPIVCYLHEWLTRVRFPIVQLDSQFSESIQLHENHPMLEIILDICVFVLALHIYHTSATPAPTPKARKVLAKSISAVATLAITEVFPPSDLWLEESIPPIDSAPLATPEVIAPLLLLPAAPIAFEPLPEPIASEPLADLSKLLVPALRKLCTERSIVWRNVNGKNKHLTKAEMLRLL